MTKKQGSYLFQSEPTISEDTNYSDIINQNHYYIVIDISTNLHFQIDSTRFIKKTGVFFYSRRAIFVEYQHKKKRYCNCTCSVRAVHVQYTYSEFTALFHVQCGIPI